MRKILGVISLAAMATAAGCDRNVTDIDAVDPVDIAEDAADTGADDVDAAPNAVSGAEDFIIKAAQTNLMEIETSKLAQTQATRPEVQQFAKTLVDDHTAANEELVTLAVAIPIAEMEPNAETQAMLTDLKNSAAGSFDSDYLDMQEEAHEKAVAMFETYQPNGAKPELDAYVAATLPTLRDHLEKVRVLMTALDAGDDSSDVAAPPAMPVPDDEAPVEEPADAPIQPDTTVPDAETPVQDPADAPIPPDTTIPDDNAPVQDPADDPTP